VRERWKEPNKGSEIEPEIKYIQALEVNYKGEWRQTQKKINNPLPFV